MNPSRCVCAIPILTGTLPEPWNETISLRTALTQAAAHHFLLCPVPALKGQDVDLLGKEPFASPVMRPPFDLFPPDCVTL